MATKAKGITISVTAATNAGCRRHMEDYLAVKLSPSEDCNRLPHLREQAYIGVFDGHGGKEAAKCARERLWEIIQSQPKYKLSDIESVKESLEEAYLALHEEMEPLRVTWKKNKTGDLSTAGTTASTVIFRQDHIFVANVGDSTAVLAVNNPLAGQPSQHPVKAFVLTKDHKPEDPDETKNIENLGGSVMTSRNGVPRVVWRRQRKFSEDGVFDSIPFLNVSRSLGDFWSYNPRTNHFTVSPKPDVNVHPLDPKTQKFIVIASDGLWNVMSPDEVVRFIWDYKCNKDECHQPRDVVRAIINEALRRWKRKKMPADNIAVLIAFLTEATVEEISDADSVVPTAEEEGASEACEASPGSEMGGTMEVCDAPPASPSLVAPELESKPVLEFATIQHVHTGLQRSPLNSFSKSPIGKHGRIEEDLEDLGEGVPSLKRCKQGMESGLSVVLVDDDSGVCSDDNSSRPVEPTKDSSDPSQLASDSPTEDLSSPSEDLSTSQAAMDSLPVM